MAGRHESGRQGCRCVSESPTWAAPQQEGPARCFWFDFGLNVGSSTEAFYKSGFPATPAMSYHACESAPFETLTHRSRTKSVVKYCSHQAEESSKLMRATMLRRLQQLGLQPTDCTAVGVELNPVYSQHLTALRRHLATKFGAPSPTFFKPFAASTCDNASVSVRRSGLYDHAVVYPGAKRMPWQSAEVFNASTVNVLRLIAERARPSDFVVLKVDVEGHETTILPCLSRSPWLRSLVDWLYIEDHNNTELLRPTYRSLQKAGAMIDLSWP